MSATPPPASPPETASTSDRTNPETGITIARDAYGFRNPDNPRLRTRCATTRRGRGHLDTRKSR